MRGETYKGIRKDSRKDFARIPAKRSFDRPLQTPVFTEEPSFRNPSNKKMAPGLETRGRYNY